MLSKSHQSRQEGRLGEVQLGVFLETPCGFFVLVDFSQKEQQILLSANHPRATPSAFTSVLPNLGIQGLLLSPPPPPLPPAVPRDKALCCEHPRQYGTAQSPGRKSGLSSKESVIAGQRPPPQPVDRPLPRASGNLHCASAARVSTPGSADGAGEQSGSPPSPAPPRGQSLAGLKRKQMFSSFLALACDLQFSSVPT